VGWAENREKPESNKKGIKRIEDLENMEFWFGSEGEAKKQKSKPKE
jgi:hypothetical protein